MKEFKNKVAAITGSATGIGRAFAEEAAKRGMRLALIDINTEGLEETKAICEKAGAAKVVTIKTDVTKYEEVRFSILRVMQEYGQLDLMFANAGIATAGWDSQVYGGGTNQPVALWCSCAAARHIVESRLNKTVAEDWMGDIPMASILGEDYANANPLG